MQKILKLRKKFQEGANVVYYDNCGEIHEGSFLCTDRAFTGMSPIDIISDVLSNDDEIRAFCKNNDIGSWKDHIFK